MKQFSIFMRSFEDIRAFVSLASQQPFAVTVGSEGQEINAKSLMAVLGLNFRRPVPVHADCDEADFMQFQHAAARFLV